MSIAFGYTISSCLWTLMITTILLIAFLLLRPAILAWHSGSLLKIVLMIIIVGVALPIYLTKAPVKIVSSIMDTFPKLQSGMLYRIDYHIQDMLYENTSTNFQVISFAIIVLVFTMVTVCITLRNCKKYDADFRHIKHLNIVADEHISMIAYDIQSKLNIKKKLPVIQHQSIDVPAIGGLFHPVIFLPEKEWTDKELRYILEHECMHYRHGDVWLKLIFMLVKSFYWWNLPLQYLFVCFDHACEYHVDHAMMKNRQKRAQIEYGQTILKALKYMEFRQKNVFYRMFGMSAFVLPDDEGLIYERVELFVKKEPKTATPMKTLFVIACSLLLTATSLAYVPYEENAVAIESTFGEYGYFVDHKNGEYDFYLDGAFQYTVTGTQAEIEAMCPPEYIFDEIPNLETVKNIGR